MIWLLNNLYPLLHGMALATSWGVLGWIVLSYLLNPKRKRTKFSKANPMLTKEEKMDRSGQDMLVITTWYVLWIIPVYRSKHLYLR